MPLKPFQERKRFQMDSLWAAFAVNFPLEWSPTSLHVHNYRQTMTRPTGNIELELETCLPCPFLCIIWPRPKSSLQSWVNFVEGLVLQSKGNKPKLHCIKLLRHSRSGPDPANFAGARLYNFWAGKKKPHIDVKKHNEIMNFQNPKKCLPCLEKMDQKLLLSNCFSHANDHVIMGGWGYHAMGLCRLLCLWNRDAKIGAKIWSWRLARKPHWYHQRWEVRKIKQHRLKMVEESSTVDASEGSFDENL